METQASLRWPAGEESYGRVRREKRNLPAVALLLKVKQEAPLIQASLMRGASCFTLTLPDPSIVDQFVFFVVPAVEFSDLFAYLLGGVFAGKFSHGLKVHLFSGGGHIQQELFCKGAVLDVA